MFTLHELMNVIMRSKGGRGSDVVIIKGLRVSI